MAFSPDGRTALSGESDGTLRLWDLDSGAVRRAFVGHKGLVSSVAFSPDGQVVLSGGTDGTLRLWDIESLWKVTVAGSGARHSAHNSALVRASTTDPSSAVS